MAAVRFIRRHGIAKLSFIVQNGQTSDLPGPFSFLHLGVGCNVPGTIVAFVNTGPDPASLNWIYGDGTPTTASGAVIAPNVLHDFSFAGKRIEGQFIAAADGKVNTLEVHFLDFGSACEYQVMMLGAE